MTQGSSNPDHPIGWSEWIQTKVETALNISQRQEGSSNAPSYQLEAQVQNLKIENQRLRQRVVELENREMEESSDRLIRALSKERFLSFKDIVQQLVNTEAEAAYAGLQRLALNGAAECDSVTGTKWRLK
jgi:predicted nuclease with TOPRIM domain